jgi:hypothetical protein
VPTARINGVQTQYTVTGAGVPALFIHGGYRGAATTLVRPPAVTATLLLPEHIGMPSATPARRHWRRCSCRRASQLCRTNNPL